MTASFKIINLKKFISQLQKNAKAVQKAGKTAVKVEGYRLKKELSNEIRSGNPGGVSFAALSVIGAYSGRPYNRKPLKKLAGAVRYKAEYHDDNLKFRFGFIAEKSSKAWARIAKHSQEGMVTTVTPRQRAALVRRGIGLSKAATDTGDAKYFFLKKTTTKLKNPARPIINPFWQAHKREASQNIMINFHKKLRGERI